jgi:rhodanese-related sulfurtransferase
MELRSLAMIFPLQSLLAVSAANPWTYVVFGLIGFAFGFALEISGFGNSKKLAAQFYFKDLTVLKVMFTAIVVAMVLIFASASLGILDFNQVWVNPTYLSSGIVGGLIMGVGFIVGGFCPGTSIVSAGTGKIDGMFFLAGGFFGAFLFGETEKYFTNWWNFSGYYGRLTLMDVFHLPTGAVVTLVVLLALFMFWGAEQLERIFAQRDLAREPRVRIAGAAVLVAGALAVLVIGTPTSAQKWARLEPLKGADLIERSVQASPAEVFKAIYDQNIDLALLDVRPEAEYNLFHLKGASHVAMADLPDLVPVLLADSAPNRLLVVMSNDETAATEAWKILTAESVPNVYILEGGLNNWIKFFRSTDPLIQPLADYPAGDLPAYEFPAALGDRYLCADPDPIEYESLQFTPKIQLQLKRDKSGGGCG